MREQQEIHLTEWKDSVLEPNREEIKEFVKWELRLAIEIHMELQEEYEDHDRIEIGEDEQVLIVGDVAEKVDDVVTDLAPDIGDWILGDDEEEDADNEEEETSSAQDMKNLYD